MRGNGVSKIGGDKSTKEEHNILMADELQERDLPKNSETVLSMGCDQIYQGTVEYLGWGVTRDLTRNSGVLRMWWDQRFAKEQWST